MVGFFQVVGQVGRSVAQSVVPRDPKKGVGGVRDSRDRVPKRVRDSRDRVSKSPVDLASEGPWLLVQSPVDLATHKRSDK